MNVVALQLVTDQLNRVSVPVQKLMGLWDGYPSGLGLITPSNSQTSMGDSPSGAVDNRRSYLISLVTAGSRTSHLFKPRCCVSCNTSYEPCKSADSENASPTPLVVPKLPLEAGIREPRLLGEAATS